MCTFVAVASAANAVLAENVVLLTKAVNQLSAVQQAVVAGGFEGENPTRTLVLPGSEGARERGSEGGVNAPAA
jgi:hypothetical protein